MLGNRVKASIRDLSWRYVIGSTLTWSGYVLFGAEGNIIIVRKALWNIAKDMRNLLQQRKPIPAETVKKVK